MSNFIFAGYLAIFVGVLKQICIPTIIIGLLQYFICKKSYKLGFIMDIMSGLIIAVCIYFTGSWLLMFNVAEQENIYFIFTFISFLIPCLLPLATSIVIQAIAYKKEIKNKKENINKMKLADL